MTILVLRMAAAAPESCRKRHAVSKGKSNQREMCHDGLRSDGRLSPALVFPFLGFFRSPLPPPARRQCRTEKHRVLFSGAPLAAVSHSSEPKSSIFPCVNEKLERQSDPYAKLVFQDGLEVTGKSFGAEASMAGEVVFNTAMVGYPEALTDPSYKGQILVLTYPIIGNYGVPSTAEKDSFGLPLHFESTHIHLSGLIVCDYSEDYSHWQAVKSLSAWLKEEGVPALYGVDTRMIAKKLRNSGSLLGKIEFPSAPIAFFDPNEANLVAEVSRKAVDVFNKGGLPKIVALDCGIAVNIIRSLCRYGAEVTVVPHDFDLEKHYKEFDGIVISNGPGNPAMATAAVKSIRYALGHEKPIFGICLGNQIMALAAGAQTFKMKFGNRAANVPVIDLRTTRCYITPQNHGYAIKMDTLSSDWAPLFLNGNDYSNEGIVHKKKPFFSTQFNPEACGCPTDTSFLFKDFFKAVSGENTSIDTIPATYFEKPYVRRVLLLGSGGLSIGQAGEFDYSGSQAIKALKEENVEVILMNPNIATVQTSAGMATRVYFLPVNVECVTQVIEKERPGHILISMGGQTALNVGIELYDNGILAKYGVQVLGTSIEAVRNTEDRQLFSDRLAEIGERVAPSHSAMNIEAAKESAKTLGYPVLIRAAFALGGLGSGFAKDEAELMDIAGKAFMVSDQILIDKDFRGWKEIEYEVVRDCQNNCVTICNMENFDPLGIHTGDSIVVAPCQTLTSSELTMLRETAIKVIRHFGIVGECNIQFALDTASKEYYIIEVNARLSRSSALASKATGYPLAYIAAKLAFGKNLVNIRNTITKITTACFEPSCDYIVCKVPRWDLNKFSKVSKKLGSSMKSVGEVMAIGRKFEEVIQKAIRMVNPSAQGFEITNEVNLNDDGLENLLHNADNSRMYYLAEAFNRGYTVEKLHALTKIDPWFLNRLRIIHDQRQFYKGKSLHDLSRADFVCLKSNGFSDIQIAQMVDADEIAVRIVREQLNVVPFVKQVDTLAAEFPASTNYLYMTYNASEDDLTFNEHGTMILGCGPYSIGSSVEFDWAAVFATRTLRNANQKTIVVNSNPETVSTDYDESDRLYFEELSFERILDIYRKEHASGVIVSVGGQTPNNLALPLKHNGVRVLGTCPENIDIAENRKEFSQMLDRLCIDQPLWDSLTTKDSAAEFANKVGYPVLVRPSFVLSGAAMSVAYNKSQLTSFLQRAVDFRSSTPVVISKFISRSKEIEFDAVADHGMVKVYAVSEHMENAGVHSGDATLVFPAQKIYVQTYRKIVRIGKAIAKELDISGPFNIQLIANENEVKVIECNLRASRTFPFISKTFSYNFIELATKIMSGIPYITPFLDIDDIRFVGVKVPQFSFTRLHGADPILGVEMASTGEVACFGRDVHEAYLKALVASGFKLPSRHGTIALTLGTDEDKASFMFYVNILSAIGFNIVGTRGNFTFYTSRSDEINEEIRLSDSPRDQSTPSTPVTANPRFSMTLVGKPDSDDKPNIISLIESKQIHLIINVPRQDVQSEITQGYKIRRAAMDYGVQLITNLKDAMAFTLAIERYYRYMDNGDSLFAYSHMDEISQSVRENRERDHHS